MSGYTDFTDEEKPTILVRDPKIKPKGSWQSLFIGKPLPTADAPHQTIGKFVGLAVFAADALSSSAYGTQEVLVILAALGSAAYQYVFPISLAIIILLAIVTLSYEQTIHAYPNGGGSYIVARDNLGSAAAKVAAASLLTDYVLTVAVSMSSGVANLVSAIPSLFDYRVWITVALVVFVMLMNLRGIKESGMAFAFPAYFFIASMLLTIGVGLYRYFAGSLGQVVDPPPVIHTPENVGALAFLILRAFSSGTSALTGVEAVSNGIPAFKEPKTKNAGQTLIMMSSILAILTLGISYLASHIHAIASEEETVISQIARTAFDGRGLTYLLVVASTTVILILAANTSFADFPRLSAITAVDGLLPRQLAYRGSRLVYSRGIVLLALLACALIIAFNASVTRLIPLYAIGVFLSFTLSQSGMAHRWWKSGKLKEGEQLVERGSVVRFDKNWTMKMVINGFGAFLTAIVAVVFAITKFTQGAWMVVIIIPILYFIFTLIQRHYAGIAQDLSLQSSGMPPPVGRRRVIVPIGGVHKGTLAALRYARSLSDDITAVHVSIEPEDAERIKEKWSVWGGGVRLVIIDSQYRTFLEPLLEYIDEVTKTQQSKEILTIVVPEFVPKRPISGFLHQKTANLLKSVLLHRKDIVITSVPYQVS